MYNNINNKINIGIVGSNFAVNVHVPAFRLNNNCHVLGITANNLEQTKIIAAKNNIPKVYKNWQTMILDPNIDAISIAVPPYIQAKIILAALEQKKAVFAEKPLTINLSDAEKIVTLAEKYNLVNMINFSFAGSKAFIAAKKNLNNLIKQIRYININWQSETKTSVEKNSNHWKTKEDLGGGILFNFASHVLFYLEWLLQPAVIEPNSITAKTSNLLGCNLGSNLLQLSVQLSNGAIVNILLSTAAFMGDGHKIEIYGNNASMILENKTNNIISGFKLNIAERKINPAANRWDNIDVSNNTSYVNQDDRIIATASLINQFIDWMQTGDIQHPNFKDGLRVNFLLSSIT